MSTVTERFFEVLDLTGETLTSLSNKIPNITTKQKLSNAKNGRNAIQIDVVEFLCASNDKINSDYILTGRGVPLCESVDTTQIYKPKYMEKLEAESVITLYDVEAAANLKTLFDNRDQNILGQISIPNIPKCDGAVYVKGDSMYPLLKSGDIVAYKVIPVDMRHIIFGEMYLVSIDMDGDEYLTVKYVNHSDKGEDWIKLVSYNQYHQPKDFPLSSVRAMALVKLSIRMNTMK